jgi:hypothetical protein
MLQTIPIAVKLGKVFGGFRFRFHPKVEES